MDEKKVGIFGETEQEMFWKLQNLKQKLINDEDLKNKKEQEKGDA